MAGWLFVDAPLEAGETLIFRRVCNQRRGRRTIGGEVSVTDRRVVFTPNRLEQLVGARPVIIDRDDVDQVEVTQPPPGAERLAFLPGSPKATVHLSTDDDVVVLQLREAAVLGQVLEQ